MRRDIHLKTARRTPEAILFGGPHGDELPTACEHRAQLLPLSIGEGARCGTYRIRTVRQGAGIECIGLRQLPRGFGKVAGLAWIDHGEG
jgi:hypothetical protein